LSGALRLLYFRDELSRPSFHTQSDFTFLALSFYVPGLRRELTEVVEVWFSADAEGSHGDARL
jgi:hypothetical protein